ncbi:sushi, von Willebrand factor type A, EGF and pentraxin domain-containing protein 1-like [Lytechinus variegatus]|uniref:sushi, von Willebrand factor type A, EGF and pentraxin domain-containing protein 1-like n=1 Tax=Lytechinus variegatus TaxID=7654 RepID=UPI001BB1C7B7|nr:sushi, von Willebrand factor type A, EGF and pentraxin domain-containing protein 1-like [Lytechinus variegatus]
MKLPLVRGLCILAITALLHHHGTDAFWRRRRRRRRATPIVEQDTTPPVFNIECPVSLGTFRTASVPFRVTWSEPTATDGSIAATVDRLGSAPGTSFSEGHHTITYQARDNVPNYSQCAVMFEVTLIKCSAIGHLDRGYVSCTEGNLVGSTCRYACFQGYTLVDGVADRVCSENRRSQTADWTGSQPRCVEMTCSDDVVSSPPEKGSVSCTQSNLFQSVCSYSCDEGYSIPPGQTRDRVCTSSGWTGSKPECQDTTGPSFEDCPLSQNIYAEDRQESGRASWSTPTAVDNSGATITDITHDGPAPGTDLPQGHYVITYTARDQDGNEGSCVFTVTVQVIRCSTMPITPGLIVDCNHGNLRGSTCQFTCSHGYSLQGPRSSSCQKDRFSGVWTSQPPTCEELQCPSLDPPENGVFLNGRDCLTSYGSSCYFDCLPGFSITNNVLRCSAHAGSDEAFWEGNIPVCEVETCDRPSIDGPLEVPDNSSLCGTEVQIPAGMECEFECTQGYFIQGEALSMCGLTGSWQNPLPTCKAVTCQSSNLPAPLHGGKSGCPHDREQFGSVCSLYCDVGYEASEPTPVRRVCEDDGQGAGVWSGGPISCSVVQCLPLEVPSHGYVESCQLADQAEDPTQRQSYGTTCVTLCSPGYTPIGTTTRRCMANGQWDGVPQTCVDVTAPNLLCPPDTVIYADPGRTVGTVNWDQFEPIQATDAGLTITAQLESIDSNPVGSKPTSLTEGEHSLIYRATDAAGNTDTCSFDLQVKVVRCPPVYAPSNGQVTLSLGQGSCEGGAVLGSTCRVTCDLGYDLPDQVENVEMLCGQIEGGSSTIGTWNESVPVCEVARCEIMPSANSSVRGCPFEDASYGDQCEFACDDGYLTENGLKRATRTCTEDGTFSGDDFVCNASVTCPSGFNLRHGTVSPPECSKADSRIAYDTACSFLCNNGFLQHGPFVKTCTADGTWSDTRITYCEDHQEPTFDEPCPRYINVNADRGSIHTTVEFTIPTASDNSGNVTVKKVTGLPGPNATFSEGASMSAYIATDQSGNAARCQIEVNVNVFRCPRPHAPARGSLVNCTDPIYGSECSYTCNQGYELDGPPTRTCELTEGQAPASWDGEQPSCRPRTCASLPTPALAVRSGCHLQPPEEETFGTLCTFYCPYGFRGIGDHQKRCQADGMWSGSDFSCEAIACSPLEVVDGATITPPDCQTDPRFGETCLLRCNTPGFQIQPRILTDTVCLGTGFWSRNITKASCVDIEEPVFTTCPNDFIVYAPQGELLADVTWNVQATDNDPTAAVDIVCNMEQGLKPEGDYAVTCTASDAQGNTQTCNFEVSVRVRRCQPLHPPVFGNIVGSCDNVWGSECEVECALGYSLVGPSLTQCNYTGQRMHWQRETAPYCDIVGCDPLDLPLNISVYPATCTDIEKLYYGTECTFFCRNGLTLEGAVHSVSCGADGEWDANVSEIEVTCIDKVAPTLTFCPGPISVIRTEIWGVEITFDLPRAQDNTDEVLSVMTVPENLTSPYNFTEDAVASYTFIDSSGNSVVCSFSVYVQDEIPPVVVFCPDDIHVNTSEVLTEVTWEAPIFEEVTGDDLLITSNHENHMATFPWGEHVVSYLASNTDNGKTVGCEFSVEVKPVTCNDLRAPGNGAISCDQWAYGRFCSIFCNNNFDIPRLPSSRKPPEHYVCGGSGLWSPHAYVPDCSAIKRPGRCNLPNELLYFSGDCGTQETLNQIAESFLAILQGTDFSDICTQSDQCTADNVRVTCGPNIEASRRGRREIPRRRAILRSKEETDMVLQMDRRTEHRLKRQVASPFVVSVEWDFEVNINQDPSLDNFAAATDAEDIMISMNDIIYDQILDGTFPDITDVPGADIILDVDSLTYDYAEVMCDDGFTADNEDLQCVPCIVGTFFDNVTRICQACPRGTYQDSEAQSSCIPCEEGQWTEEDASTNHTQCLDICDAGHFSPTGVAPCELCPIGTYQPETLSTSCLQCPNGTNTMASGSNHIQQCIEPCQPGSFSPSGFVPCDLCPLGSYQNQVQRTSCDLCPGHLSTNNTGALSVQECTDINECVSEPCQNGATCVDLRGNFQCICAPGFTGSNCEIDVDECALYRPCLHSGTCLDRVNGYSCICLPGYTGVECEKPFDLCQSLPCQNNATCFSSPTHYECLCTPGYHGDDCQWVRHPCSPNPCPHADICRVVEGEYGPDYECEYRRVINECYNQPCFHGGLCFDTYSGFLCLCTSGYEGRLCQIDIDLCLSDPCMNNGTCFDLDDTFECLCKEGYAGELCERHRNACDDAPCLHGGSCQPIEGASHLYTCECLPGFIGRNCEVNRDDCASIPCSNGATCMDDVDGFTCACTEEFTGPTCDVSIDLCTQKPCGPNATCLDQVGGYQCLCPPGRTGEVCQDAVDFCQGDDQCLNGGSCISHQETFSCLCVPGYQGSQCEIDIDECASAPCFHGSACLDLIGNFSCVCASGFSGPTCEENIDDCLSSPCINGTCHDGINSWSCDCFNGYHGEVCDVPIDFCQDAPCLNNGICLSLQTGFSCTCLSGFTGPTCEVNIDECSSFPCIQGSCLDDVDSYTCQCDEGFTGIRCETDQDECRSAPCLNNGTCTDRPRGYTCQCPVGFEGTNCEINVDDCFSNECENNATCVDEVAGFRCRCPQGYTGLLCQLPVTPACSSYPCANGGSCLEDDVGFRCECLEGFNGTTCEIDVDDCVNNGCENGATCIDQVLGYICQCPPGYNGTYCEMNIDECLLQPCLNDATCIDQVSGFQCVCKNGYTGHVCDTDIDECGSNPCMNRGSCEDAIGGYICNCTVGFRGIHCEEASMECESNPCLNQATCMEGYTQFVCQCAPGYTGLLCETALPSDFDVIFNSGSEVVHLADIQSGHSSHMTVSSWMRVLAAPQDFLIFGYIVNDEAYSLFNPCSLKVFSKSTSFSIGSSLCDNAWHHISLQWSFEPDISWILSVDQGRTVFRNRTLSSARGIGQGSIVMGSDSMGQKDYVVMSGVNVWASHLNEQALDEISSTCQPALFGDVVSWTDVLSSKNITSSQIESPSMCDAVNECASNPCIRGACENKLDGFHCECESGYKGELCADTQDLCSDELCKNAASCQTIEGEPICLCRDGFSGQFCETRKVDGAWSHWSLWSECSTTCGGGTRSRSRACTNPAPQGGGLNCSGKAEQVGMCNEFECPGCLRLRRPLRGYLNCDEQPEMTNCTISCRHGYGFAERVMNSYYCGKDTNYRWNHQTSKNRRAVFPSCTELSKSHGSTGVVEVGFPGAVCSSASDKESLKQAAYQSLNAHSDDIDCLKDKSCKILRIQVLNCQLETNKRRSIHPQGEVRISITVSENDTYEQYYPEADNITDLEISEPLDLFYYDVSSLLTNDSLTLEINDEILHSDPSSFTGDVWENCPPGYIEGSLDGYCVPCGIGTYYGMEGNATDYECYSCPLNTYQDEEGQDECILCPPNTFTDDFHTSNITDCKVPPPIPVIITLPPTQPPDHFPLPLILSVTTGAIVLLVLVLLLVAWCKRRHRNKTGSFPTQDIQMLNAATAGTKGTKGTYKSSEEQSPGITNHAFVFGGDDSSSSKEKMSTMDSGDTNFTFRESSSDYPTLRVGTTPQDDLQVYLPPKTPTTFGTK